MVQLEPSDVVMYTPNLLRLTPIILVMLIFTVRDQHTVGQLIFIPGRIRITGLDLLCTINQNELKTLKKKKTYKCSYGLSISLVFSESVII